MKTVVEWGWPIGLTLMIAGLVTSLVLDDIYFGRDKPVPPVGGSIAIGGALVLVVMLCIPASYQPL